MRRSPQTEGPTRRGLLAATVAAMGLGACGDGDDGAHSARQEGVDPEAAIEKLTAGLSPDNKYRDPDAGERATARRAARALAAGKAGTPDVGRDFAELGLAAHDGAD